MALSKEEKVELVLLSQYKFKTKITDSIHLTRRTKNECTKIEGNTMVLHRVNANFAQRIYNTFALQVMEIVLTMSFQ